MHQNSQYVKTNKNLNQIHLLYVHKILMTVLIVPIQHSIKDIYLYLIAKKFDLLSLFIKNKNITLCLTAVIRTKQRTNYLFFKTKTHTKHTLIIIKQ